MRRLVENHTNKKTALICFFFQSGNAMFDLSILALPDNAHPVGLDEAPW
jgi:hypothetical protein